MPLYIVAVGCGVGTFAVLVLGMLCTCAMMCIRGVKGKLICGNVCKSYSLIAAHGQKYRQLEAGYSSAIAQQETKNVT